MQMVKMMITVVIIYAACWLPLHTITLVGDSHPNIWKSVVSTESVLIAAVHMWAPSGECE